MREALKRALLACLLVSMAACGGGGSSGGGGGGGGGFSLSFDRSNVSMSFDVDDTPAVAVVNVAASGTTTDDVYVGATTPNDQPDPNIDHVDVQIGTTSARAVIYPAEDLAPGTYTGTVVLMACKDSACTRHHTGSPQNVSYTITVHQNFRVTPRPLSLQGDGGVGAAQQVSVTLPPGVTTYTVSAADGWATIDQQSATGFRLTAAPRAAGTYQTALTLQSGGYSRTVPVTYIALTRQLRLSASRVDVASTSGATAQADITVEQLAEGQTGITASVNASWLSVSNVSASGLRVQAASLPSGTYTAELTVTSGTQQRLLPVSYVVAAPAGGDRHLSTAQTSLSFAASEGTAATPQTLGLQRPSWNPDVTVAINPANTAWLSTRTLPNGDIEVSASAVGLSSGTHSAQIVLTPAYPDAPRAIPVALTVGNGLATPPNQRLVLNNDSTQASLQGSIPVRSNGATSVQWTATSSAAWLQLSQNQGPLGQDVQFQVDLQAALLLPDYTDQPATVTISAPGFTSVTNTVTLRRELAEIYYVGPGSITAGKPAQVIVRGRGFGGLQNPANRFTIAGVTPTSVTRLSDSSLAVQLPALAAGGYAIGMSGTGSVAATTTLHVLAEQAYPSALVPTGGVAYSTVYDPVSRTVYSANSTLSAVRRSRYQAGNWVTDSLALPALHDIGLSPDGKQLVAVERSGLLHLIDTGTFTISQTYTMPGPAAQTPTGNRGLAVTNDGKVWLSIGSGWNSLFTFDLRSRTFAQVTIPNVDSQFHGGPWFEVSRNGERLVMVSSASISPRPPMRYLDASEGIFRVVPGDLEFFYWSLNGMGDTASRFLFNAYAVYDASYARVGGITIPDSGWWASAAVMAPDSRKVYVFAIREGAWNVPSSTTMPRIYVFDSSIAAGTQADLPLLGSFDLPSYPTCRFDSQTSECVRPTMTAAPDGKTLFVTGTVGMSVIPLNATYTGLSSRGVGAQALKRWDTRANAK